MKYAIHNHTLVATTKDGEIIVGNIIDKSWSYLFSLGTWAIDIVFLAPDLLAITILDFKTYICSISQRQILYAINATNPFRNAVYGDTLIFDGYGRFLFFNWQTGQSMHVEVDAEIYSPQFDQTGEFIAGEYEENDDNRLMIFRRCDMSLINTLHFGDTSLKYKFLSPDYMFAVLLDTHKAGVWHVPSGKNIYLEDVDFLATLWRIFFDKIHHRIFCHYHYIYGGEQIEPGHSMIDIWHLDFM